jgi:hypothetical protein
MHHAAAEGHGVVSAQCARAAGKTRQSDGREGFPRQFKRIHRSAQPLEPPCRGSKRDSTSEITLVYSESAATDRTWTTIRLPVGRSSDQLGPQVRGLASPTASSLQVLRSDGSRGGGGKVGWRRRHLGKACQPSNGPFVDCLECSAAQGLRSSPDGVLRVPVIGIVH